MTQKFHEPYSPTILETTVSERFVDIVNTVADDVLADEEKMSYQMRKRVNSGTFLINW